MSGFVVIRLFFACLALFWDLTDGRTMEKPAPQHIQTGDSHCLSDVFPYSLRFRQETLSNVVVWPALSPQKLPIALIDSGPAPDSPDERFGVRRCGQDELLYDLMSLQR
jgi:hypothetical protein